MKKSYRNFVLIIAIIPAILIIVATCIRLINIKLQPTKEEYNLLKEYSLQIGAGVPIKEIEQKGVKATAEILEKSVEIKVQGENCKVMTTIGFSEEVSKIENGKVHSEKSINFEDVCFYEEALISTRFEIILKGISGSIAWIAVILIIFIGIPNSYKTCKKEEEEKKSKKIT